MSKLGWTAAAGLSVGCVALGLTVALGADEWSGFRFDDLMVMGACEPDATGSGVPDGSERRWAWTEGDNVVVMVPADVHYRGGEGDQVIVRGAPSLVSRVRIEGGEISMCKGNRGGGRLEVTLPGRQFRSMSVAGSADMTLENVTSPDLMLGIAGSGNIRAQGTSENVKINIAGSGDAHVADLAVKNMKLDIAGSGSAEAAPQDSLDLRIAGSGELKLLSQPKQLSTKIAGSGKIIQVAGGTTKHSD